MAAGAPVVKRIHKLLYMLAYVTGCLASLAVSAQLQLDEDTLYRPGQPAIPFYGVVMTHSQSVVQRVQKLLYVVPYVAGRLARLAVWAQSEDPPPLESGGLTVYANQPAILIGAVAWAGFGRIIGLVLLWKMWQSIQGGFARATPAKAVGLLLLPVINLYWMFQAYWGWTKDFNRFAHSRYLRVQPMPEEIALLACVMSLVPIPAALLFSGLPDPRFSIILGWMATMVEMALTAYLFWRACDGINAVARLYAAAAAGVPHQAPNGAVP